MSITEWNIEHKHCIHMVRFKEHINRCMYDANKNPYPICNIANCPIRIKDQDPEPEQESVDERKKRLIRDMISSGVIKIVKEEPEQEEVQ